MFAYLKRYIEGYMYLTRRKGTKVQLLLPIEPPRNTRIHSNLKPYQTLKFPLLLPLPLPTRGQVCTKTPSGLNCLCLFAFFILYKTLSLAYILL